MTVERQIDYEVLVQDAMRGVVRTILSRVAEHGLPGEHHFYISFNTLAPGVSIAPRLLAKYPSEMTIVLQHRFWDLHVQQDRFEVKLTFDSIRERLVIPFAAVRVFFDPSVPYGMQFEDPSAEGRQTAKQSSTGDARHSNIADAMGFGGGRSGVKAGPRAQAERPAPERKKAARRTKADATADAADATAHEADAPSKPAVAAKSDAAAAQQPAASAATPGAKSGPRLVETANDSAKVVSLDQFRKK